MQIRQDIVVLPPDLPRKSDIHGHFFINAKGRMYRRKPMKVLGWTVTETMGLAVINPNGIDKGSKTTIIE